MDIRNNIICISREVAKRGERFQKRVEKSRKDSLGEKTST